MPRTHRICAAFLAGALLTAATGMPHDAAAAESQGRTGIDGAAEALRNELGPVLLTYENLQKQRGAQGSVDIGNARVQGLQDVMYDGNSVRPTITLKLDGATLVEGTDFDVTFEGDEINPGYVSVTIEGKGAYTGTIETGFTILPGDLAYATVDVIPDQTATGEELQPAPTVKLDGKTLVEGIDYTVSYADNVEKGTAAIVVTGIGNCTGQQHASFEVLEAPDESAAGSGVFSTLPLVAGPACAAAVALGIVALTIAKRRRDDSRA